MRQFIVTHKETGQQTLVNCRYPGNYGQAAARAGHRYPFDCTVALVPLGSELALPFDTLPHVIRRARVVQAQVAA